MVILGGDVYRGCRSRLSNRLPRDAVDRICKRCRVPYPKNHVVAALEPLALAFLHLNAQLSENPRRMRTLAKAVGAETIFAEASLAALPLLPESESQEERRIGFISLGDFEAGAFGIGLAFGRVDAAALRALAYLAERYGDGTLRTTPWRARTVQRAPLRSTTAPVTPPRPSVMSSRIGADSQSGSFRSCIDQRRRATPAEPQVSRRERLCLSTHGRSL